MPFLIEMEYLELHDNEVMDLDAMSWSIYEDLFRVVEKPRKPQEKDEDVQIMITIERDFNVLSLERVAYTTFDMLSDVGGLSGILIIFF